MKKRQRKKNAKKAFRTMKGLIMLNQLKLALVQMSRKYTSGGIVPDSQGLTGDIVKTNMIKEMPIAKHGTITINLGGIDK